MKERRIGPYGPEHFDNDLSEGRGKMSKEEYDELMAMALANCARANEILRLKQLDKAKSEALASRANTPEGKDKPSR